MAGLILETAGQFVEDGDKAEAKLKVEEFWFFIATLSTQQSVSEAIKFRRRRMKHKYIGLFLKMYWILLAIVVIDILYQNFSMDISTVRSNFEQIYRMIFPVGNLLYIRKLLRMLRKSATLDTKLAIPKQTPWTRLINS